MVEGDLSPDGKGKLAIERGIEVGHVFYLGTKYSAPMNASFLDESGKPQLMEMGCYGIGITRLPAAAIEQNNDERGIIWPDAIAPFTVVVCPIGMDRSAEVKAAAEKLHDDLAAAGVDVMLDDRGERPGAMFADWELIGVPHRVVDLRPRPEGRAARVPAPPRQRGHQGAGGRRRFASCAAAWPRDLAARVPAGGRRGAGGVAAPAPHARAPRSRSRSPTRCARRSVRPSPMRRRRSRTSPTPKRAWPTCAGWAR